MFDLMAQAGSCTVGGGFGVGLVVFVEKVVIPFLKPAADSAADSAAEIVRLELENRGLRDDLAIERSRARGVSTAIATPTVKETIDRTARTIEDTCRHVTEMAEKLPAARSRKSSPRKRKNTETIETAEAPNETPPE